jgi:uncharacterized protein
MRIVLDTNALVAARFSPGGAAGRIFQLCLEGRLEAIYTPEIEGENRAILERVRPPLEFRDRLESYFRGGVRVTSRLVLDVVEDSDDNKYLECAITGGADYIISSDHHLLAFDGVEGVRICKAGCFLEEWSALDEGRAFS